MPGEARREASSRRPERGPPRASTDDAAAVASGGSATDHLEAKLATAVRRPAFGAPAVARLAGVSAREVGMRRAARPSGKGRTSRAARPARELFPARARLDAPGGPG